MPGDQPRSLSTDRLLLRQWQPSDAEPFARLNADPAVMEHFVAPLDRAASDAMAGRCRAAIERDGWGLWAVEVRATGEFIGFTGLARPVVDAPFMPAVEIGWRLARSAWGHGYATEAATAAAAFGFDDVGLSEIVSFTAVRNLRSRAVMERLGMTHDPHDDFDHPRIPEGHPLRRHVLYRLRRQVG
ncbi:GNAT family N-acetyltransferase [Yinghuangia aomiensis]|uniref:GNAT family N-acetyltransferase n=1 Tax=Yinghuangia aomiensis TaxID=676205 RepID=A0ABP9HPW4_9ACTN